MSLLASLYLAFWLLLSIGSFLVTLNAFAPSRRPLPLFVVSFFSSWLTMELPIHHMLLLLTGATVLFALGLQLEPVALVALAMNLCSVVLLGVHLSRGRSAGRIMKQALKGYVEDGRWPRVPASKLLYPFHPSRRGVTVRRDVVYGAAAGQRLRLDLYQPDPNAFPGPRPILLQIHGGAWVVGSKREQGLPLLQHAAANGWLGLNVDYRLSPAATFPDHLIDIKRAIAWAREHADELNADPSFLAVTGGSAGGHLTALTALTVNDPRYQPGFEDADTSVQAALPIYAVYDFTDRLRIMGRPFIHRILEPLVMKAFLAEEPEKFRDASPLDLVHPDAPPMLVVHGTHDTLAPVEYARLFVQELGKVSQAPVLYAELAGAQHAFDIFASPRTVRVIAGMERFLHETWRRHQQARPASSDQTALHD